MSYSPRDFESAGDICDHRVGSAVGAQSLGDESGHDGGNGKGVVIGVEGGGRIGRVDYRVFVVLPQLKVHHLHGLKLAHDPFVACEVGVDR